MNKSPFDVATASFSRRGLLRGAAYLAASIALTLGRRVHAAAPPDVYALAAFLTGKSDLSIQLVVRAYEALMADDPAFAGRMRALWTQILSRRFADADAFRTSDLFADPDASATAIALVSALYLGRVGNSYHGHFIAYEEALMYRPTADVMVVPTFSRGAPGYWSEEPVT